MSTDLIRSAALQLDPEDDAHWTADGLPRIDVLEELTGLKNLLRADVTTALPQITRDNPLTVAPPPLGENDPEQAQGLESEGDAELSDEDRALRAAEQELIDARKQLAEATARRDVALAKVDRLRSQVAAEQSNVPAGLNIRRYLDTQVTIRQQAAENAHRLREAGIDTLVEQLNTASPLDAALANKSRTARGSNAGG